MTISAWFSLLLAIPVLLLGEFLLRRVRMLSRCNIPAAVIGGLLISFALLGGNLAGLFEMRFDLKTAAPWWTWLVTAEPDWRTAPSRTVNLPFLVAFFTCIGLNASWDAVRRGGLQVVTFLLVSTCLAVIQNCVGVVLSKLLGVSPLLGLVCGSVTLTGGHATALGFAADLERAGFAGATVVAMAAATFGLISGALLGGPVGAILIRKCRLKPCAFRESHLESDQAVAPGFLQDLRGLQAFGRLVLPHLLVLLVCLKLGAWVSYFLQAAGWTFPVTMGSMLLGLAIRNGLDLAGARWIQTEIIDTLASVTLGIFLVMAMMSLNLLELAGAAVPMVIMLAVQVAVMALFAWFVTFRVMGRDYDAAVMAAGHCGFGLGATSNAIASMKSLVESFGPAPRAFLVVPLVGALLIDVSNAFNITFFINLVK